MDKLGHSLAALVALLAASCSAPAAAKFDSPEAAVAELIRAMRTEDRPRLIEIVGPENADLVDSGDAVADREDRRRFVALYDEKQRLAETGDGARALSVGEIDWPMPIPIVATDGGWTFDVAAGREEVIYRRIGRNELETIQVCRAVVDAQREYCQEDRDGDGIREYARRLSSSPRTRDGLFWETSEGEPPSPLGELLAKASGEGYSGEKSESFPYRGYRYRLIERQGEHAPGGAVDYVVREDMIGGFAVIAYPAEYGRTGVMSFMVGHDGIVLEKDLGPDSARVARAMERYDPREWTEVRAE